MPSLICLTKLKSVWKKDISMEKRQRDISSNSNHKEQEEWGREKPKKSDNGHSKIVYTTSRLILWMGWVCDFRNNSCHLEQ